MAAIEQLLAYQKEDGALRKIEQELASSGERKKLVQARNIIKAAESRIAAEDVRAVELERLRDSLIARAEEMERAIAEYADLDEMVEGGGDISFYKKNAQQLQDRLRAAKADFNKLISEIESLSAEYRKLMEQGKAVNRQYKEYSERFKAVQAARADEVNAIKAKLSELEKTIPPDIMEKYRTKRKENVFPVLVPLTNGMCVCGMNLSLAQQEKLQGGNVIECEHCHRFIYKA